MQKFNLFIKIVVFGFIIAAIYHFILGKFFGLGWPYSTFLFNPNDRFNDFPHITVFGKHLLNGESPYKFKNSYMPLSNWLVVPFALINNTVGLIIYIMIIIIFFFYYIYINLKKLNMRKNVIKTGIIVLTSYPLIYVLDRGNFEGLVFIFLVIFFHYYIKGEFFLSALFLALSASFKPFTAIFLVLYISDKRYKEGSLFVLFSSVFYLLGIKLLPEGFKQNIIYLIQNLKSFNNDYVKNAKECGTQFFNHTIFNPINILNSNLHVINSKFLAVFYFITIIIIFSMISYYVIRFESILWRKVLLLTLMMVTFPFVSFDYTFINLYIPIILFFKYNNNENITKLEKYIVILLAALLIPKQYLISNYTPYSISVYINPLISIAIIISIIRDGLRRKITI